MKPLVSNISLAEKEREDFQQRRGSNLEGQTCILTTMKERIKNMIEEEQNQ